MAGMGKALLFLACFSNSTFLLVFYFFLQGHSQKTQMPTAREDALRFYFFFFF
jgi:hypothetical protein